MKSAIGKLYVPQDNSHCVSLPNHLNGGLIGVTCVIISEPYIEKVEIFPKTYKERVFVNVMSVETHLTYRVLFNESWIYNKIKPRDIDDGRVVGTIVVRM